MLLAIEILIQLTFACFQFGSHFLKIFKLNHLPEAQEELNSLKESVSQPNVFLCLFKCYHLNSTPKVYGQHLKWAVRHILKRLRYYLFVQSNFIASDQQHRGLT